MRPKWCSDSNVASNLSSPTGTYAKATCNGYNNNNGQPFWIKNGGRKLSI